jgi:hypothetical protein
VLGSRALEPANDLSSRMALKSDIAGAADEEAEGFHGGGRVGQISSGDGGKSIVRGGKTGCGCIEGCTDAGWGLTLWRRGGAGAGVGTTTCGNGLGFADLRVLGEKWGIRAQKTAFPRAGM